MNKSLSTKTGIRIDTIAIIVLVILIAFASVYVATPYFYPESNEIVYSSSYKNINPQAAYNLINKTRNLIIIDCRGLEGCGPCQIRSDGRLDFDFVFLNINPLVHYNTTENLLVYSKDGTVAEKDFCKLLVNHVYGKIYNLKGGFDAWKEAGYPISYYVPPEYSEELES